eukprot:5882266-Prymnesium_polylepis.1
MEWCFGARRWRRGQRGVGPRLPLSVPAHRTVGRRHRHRVLGRQPRHQRYRHQRKQHPLDKVMIWRMAAELVWQPNSYGSRTRDGSRTRRAARPPCGWIRCGRRSRMLHARIRAPCDRGRQCAALLRGDLWRGQDAQEHAQASMGGASPSERQRDRGSRAQPGRHPPAGLWRHAGHARLPRVCEGDCSTLPRAPVARPHEPLPPPEDSQRRDQVGRSPLVQAAQVRLLRRTARALHP